MIKLAEQFVPLKVNGEKDGVELAKKYAVRAFPHLMFVDMDGEIWGAVGGYVPPSGFIEAASPILELYANMPKVEAALKRNPQDGPANCAMARLEAARAHPDKAENYLKVAQNAGFKGPELAKAFFAVGDCHQKALAYDLAIEWFLKGREASINSADASYALISVISCCLNKKDQAGAKKYAQMLVDLKDGTPEYVQIAKQILGKP